MEFRITKLYLVKKREKEILYKWPQITKESTAPKGEND
jgi:hypothetical protein